jgi:hypothetical protein
MVSATPTLFAFVIFALVSCGYLVMRVVIVIVARSAPLAAISVWSVILG